MANKSNKHMDLINDTDKLTVLKSKPLYSLWDSDLTLAEFKLLDTYLGRIDSHNEDNRTVKFEKGKLEELLGVKQIKPNELDKRIDHLMTTIRIPDTDSPRGFYRIALFEEAHLVQDEYGLWECELTCTQKARKYVFNIENLGYIRYKLRNVINLKSRYSYFLYLYVWDNKYRGNWEISLGELKAMLNCDKDEYYKEFKRFNEKILKKAQEEIHKETDIKFEYETVKRGRSVVGIKFTYLHQEILDDDVDKNQISIDEWFEAEQKEREIAEQKKVMTEYDLIKAQAEAWKDEIPRNWLTPEELDLLAEKIYQIPEAYLPPPTTQYDDISTQRVSYVRELVKKANYYKARNKFNYLMSVVSSDIKG